MTLQVEFQPQALGADAGSAYRVPTPGPQGEPGYSPTVTVETITGGHRVTITDAAGDHVFSVMDGEPGPEGYSPVVTITEISGGHRVTITDAEHPDGQSFDVMDGTGGGGGTSDYEDLSNLPQIAGVTLIGNKTLAELGAGTYSKPSGGIPKTDLASGVQGSLDKADAALPKTGGAMSGAIAMGANKITGLAAGTADGDAVNVSQMASAISQSVAYFRGSFASRAALLAVSWQTTDPEAAHYVTNNDYAVVLDDETQSDECWRYIYVSGTGWTAQYRINETPLTQAQLDALNSGATAANIGAITGKYDANNPPPYPVTSVNGLTGAVTLSIPATAADVGAIAAPVSPASGQFLQWNGSAWVAASPSTTKTTIWSGDASSSSSVEINLLDDVTNYDFLLFTCGVSGSTMYPYTSIVDVSMWNAGNQNNYYGITALESASKYNSAVITMKSNTKITFQSFSQTWGAGHLYKIVGVKLG